MKAFPVIGLQKVTYRKFYRRLQGIYRKIYRTMPSTVLEGLKVKKMVKKG